MLFSVIYLFCVSPYIIAIEVFYMMSYGVPYLTDMFMLLFIFIYMFIYIID